MSLNKSLLLIVVTFFAMGTLSAQNKIKWLGTSSIDDKIKVGDRKFFIYFYFDGCKWCQYMDNTTLSSDGIAKVLNNNYYAVRFDAMMPEKITIHDHTYGSVKVQNYNFNQFAVDMLGGVMSFPSIVFLDEDFKKIDSVAEYIDIEKMEMILSYFAGNHHKNTMFRRYTQKYCRDSHFTNLVKGQK